MGFTLLLLLSDGIVIAQNKNWPQFRGPNSSGIADKSAKPPIELDEQNTIWKTPLPFGYSSPAIWGSNIFVTGFVEGQKELQLICMDRNTGGINWRYVVRLEKIETFHPNSGPAATSPVTDGEIVCAYWGSYGLICVDMKGNLLWESRMPAAEEAEGISTSPIIAGKGVIFIQPGNGDPCIIALHRVTGDTLWKTGLPNVSKFGTDNHSTPIVWKDQVILHRKGEIVAHSIETGGRLWWVSSPTKGVSTPVIGKDRLYVGGWSNFGEPEGRLAVKLDGIGDITLSNVLWTEKKAVPEVPSPIYFDGRIYMVKDGGLITCMDAENGRVLFMYEQPSIYMLLEFSVVWYKTGNRAKDSPVRAFRPCVCV